MCTIPVSEYAARLARFQANIRAAGLDACLVHGNEADFANVRYLSEYWPTFEAGGVFVPAEGNPILLIGPESENYARGRSVIPDIMKLIEYRESAEPEYPGIPIDTFRDVADAAMNGRPLKKLGLVSYSITTLPVLDGLKKYLPDTELVKADRTLLPLRFVKSENELNCMREAFRIAELALDAIFNEAKVGMTEFQVIGIAQREIYRHGGEYEGHALYCFSGERTNNAICRPTARRLRANELIQLNIGARVGGYSSSVGLPFSFGPLPDEQRRLVEFGLKAHRKTVSLLKAGIPAASVVKDYEAWVKSEGFAPYMLYGPCHAIGMMEVEQPWMESVSTYELAENMTFQVDTFFADRTCGLRWENGVVIKPGQAELLSGRYMKIMEL